MSTPFLRFPGVASNYVDTQDVNKLTADSAGIVQDKGGWDTGTVSTDQAFFGPSSLKVEAPDTSSTLTPIEDAASFSVYVYPTVVGSFQVNTEPVVALPAGQWTQLTAPGNAGTYAVSVTTAAQTFYVDAACLQASGAAWVPSVRVAGDLDLRMDVDTQWSTGGDIRVFGRGLSGSEQYMFMYRPSDQATGVWRRDVGGVLRFDWGLPSGGSFTATGRRLWQATSVFSGTDRQVDLKVDGDTVHSFLYTLAFTKGVPTGDHDVRFPVREDLFAGDVRYCEVRDGVDGPVVARMDAADAARATLL